mmetsp:Transcript_40234/g.65354  ORF Transcript_40234/g.65354 Transcript_40234/m.65354 type:complete len:98 (-) Transcript_40234:1343-1636(-)
MGASLASTWDFERQNPHTIPHSNAARGRPSSSRTHLTDLRPSRTGQHCGCFETPAAICASATSPTRHHTTRQKDAGWKRVAPWVLSNDEGATGLSSS